LLRSGCWHNTHTAMLDKSRAGTTHLGDSLDWMCPNVLGDRWPILHSSLEIWIIRQQGVKLLTLSPHPLSFSGNRPLIDLPTFVLSVSSVSSISTPFLPL